VLSSAKYLYFYSGNLPNFVSVKPPKFSPQKGQKFMQSPLSRAFFLCTSNVLVVPKVVMLMIGMITIPEESPKRSFSIQHGLRCLFSTLQGDTSLLI